MYGKNHKTERRSTIADAPRSLSTIAKEIVVDWKPMYFGAVPYVNALLSLSSVTDTYGADSARSIVNYFLANAQTWRGPKARAIKEELKGMLRPTLKEFLES